MMEKKGFYIQFGEDGLDIGLGDDDAAEADMVAVTDGESKAPL